MPHQEFIGPDGKRWPSATHLTDLVPKPWLWAWYENSVRKDGYNGWLKNKRTSEEGKKLGTQVHYWLDAWVKKLAVGDSYGQPGADLAASLWDKVNPTVEEWVEGDKHLVCNRLKIHGSCDAIVRKVYEPGLVVGDFKTSYKVDPAHPLQLCVYALCWNEEHPDQKIDKGEIWRVDKDSKNYNVKIDTYDGLLKYEPIVAALRTIWGFIND